MITKRYFQLQPEIPNFAPAMEIFVAIQFPHIRSRFQQSAMVHLFVIAIRLLSEYLFKVAILIPPKIYKQSGLLRY